jgi:hypothetical protein
MGYRRYREGAQICEEEMTVAIDHIGTLRASEKLQQWRRKRFLDEGDDSLIQR